MTKLEVGGKPISQKQWDVLILWIDNKTYQEIAEELGISARTIKQRIATFKKNFPDAYENIWNIKKMDAETKRNLQNPIFLSELADGDGLDFAVDESITWDGRGERIKEKF